MKLLLKLAAKNLIGAGKRTWLNVIVLSFSFIVIIWHKGVLNGWEVQAKTDMTNWETGGGQYWNQTYDPFDPFTLTEAHSKVPVSLTKENIEPVLITQGTIYPNGRIQSILIKGISTKQKVLKLPAGLLEGDINEIPAIIGRRMAEDNRLKEGDIVVLRWRDKNGTFDAGEIKIKGIFDTNVPTVDAGQIWLPLEKLQKMMGMEGEATILICATNFKETEIASGWIFKSDETLTKTITDMIKMKSVSGMFLYIILISLAMLAIFDTQILSIFRRQKEIGTYIALGMTRSQVVGLFTIEGSLNSVLAGLLAVLYGTPLLALQAIKGMSIPGGSKNFGIVMADKIYPAYTLELVIVTIIVIMITTTIVSYLPSRRIAKMKPTEALRGKLQ